MASRIAKLVSVFSKVNNAVNPIPQLERAINRHERNVNKHQRQVVKFLAKSANSDK